VKRSRFTETQIVAILKELEAGIATNDLCRKHGAGYALEGTSTRCPLKNFTIGIS